MLVCIFFWLFKYFLSRISVCNLFIRQAVKFVDLTTLLVSHFFEQFSNFESFVFLKQVGMLRFEM